MTPAPSNGINGRVSIIIRPVTLTAISTFIGVTLFIAGGWFGYSAFRSEMVANSQSIADLKVSTTMLQQANNALTLDLAALKSDMRHLVQDIAEIKLVIVPKR